MAAPVTEKPEVELCRICGRPLNEEPVLIASGPFAGMWMSEEIVHQHDLPGPHARREVSVGYLQRQCYGKGLLDTYAECSMAGLVAPPDVRHKADEFIAGFDGLSRRQRRGLLVFGQTGVGKSYLAAAIANELMRRQHACRWTRLEPLMRMEPQEQRLAMAALASEQTDLVVIDDFGAERATSYGTAQTFEIVAELHERNACLIVTTNLTRSQIASPGSVEARRIVERLKDRCRCVEYVGPNKRQSPISGSAV